MKQAQRLPEAATTVQRIESNRRSLQRSVSALRATNSRIEPPDASTLRECQTLLSFDASDDARGMLTVVRLLLLEQLCFSYLLLGRTEDAMRCAKQIQQLPGPRAYTRGTGLEAVCHALGGDLGRASICIAASLNHLALANVDGKATRASGVTALAFASLLVEVHNGSTQELPDGLAALRLAAQSEGIKFSTANAPVDEVAALERSACRTPTGSRSKARRPVESDPGLNHDSGGDC